jgi:glycosyltransferase involved in cell wall biosynthesis
MYRDHTVGVVIPAYNEEGFVGDVIDSVPSFVDRVYVVDDASTDGTWAEIRRHAARVNEDRDERRVVPIQHSDNRGPGGAIKTGYRRALADGVDVTVNVGGDGQMDQTVMDRLLDPVVEGRADYTKGNRLLARTDRGEMPHFRFVGNAMLGGLTKIASGYWETGDPQTGYTAISKRALEAIDIRSVYEYYGYPNDLLVKLNVAEMRVVDIPVPINYGDEESSIEYGEYIPRVSWMLLRNFLWRLRTKYLVFGFHPLVVVYAVGALATLLGIGGFVAAAAAGATGATGLGVTATSAGVSALLGLGGVLSLSWAMVLDRAVNDELDEREFDGVAHGGPGDEQREDGRLADGSSRNGTAGATKGVELEAAALDDVIDAVVEDADGVVDVDALEARIRRRLFSDGGDADDTANGL